MTENYIDKIRRELRVFTSNKCEIQKKFLCYKLGENITDKTSDQLTSIIERYQRENYLDYNKIYKREDELKLLDGMDSLSKTDLQMKAKYYGITFTKKTTREQLIFMIKFVNGDLSVLYDSNTLRKLSGPPIKMLANHLGIKYFSFDSNKYIQLLIELYNKKRKLHKDQQDLIDNSHIDDRIAEYRYIKNGVIVDNDPLDNLKNIIYEVSDINRNLNDKDIYLYDSYVKEMQSNLVDLINNA